MADPGSAASHDDAVVFISYSRKDKSFAQRLSDALKAAGRKPWTDWKDITLTAKWLEQIEEGIKAADVFVVIISPNSLISEHCHTEINLARRNYKRIVPIVLEAVEEKALVGEWYKKSWEQIARDNWEDILKWQWLMFEGDFDFQQSVANLIETIDKDLDHVQSHKNLLARSQAWERKERNKDLLLHGIELYEAEEWLTLSVNKEPQPSKLHREYIEASYAAELENRENEKKSGEITKREQERANKLRKRFFYFIAAVIVIGASAGLGGINSQNHALDETARSDDATSWSPDETRVLIIDTAVSDELVYIWDAVTGAKLQTLIGHTDTVRDAAWSPDGTKIATASIDNTARIWDAATGKELYKFTDHTDHISVIAWSPDGTRLVTGGDDRIARVWDAVTGKVLATFALHTSAITSAQWSRDGSEIITTDHNRHTYIWDSATGDEITDFSGTGRS